MGPPPSFPKVMVREVKLRLFPEGLVKLNVIVDVPGLRGKLLDSAIQAKKLALAVLAELIVNVKLFVKLVMLPVQFTIADPLGTPVSVTSPPEIKLLVDDLQSAVEGVWVIDPDPLVTDFVNT